MSNPKLKAHAAVWILLILAAAAFGGIWIVLDILSWLADKHTTWFFIVLGTGVVAFLYGLAYNAFLEDIILKEKTNAKIPPNQA